jgi:hypothetical protein
MLSQYEALPIPDQWQLIAAGIDRHSRSNPILPWTCANGDLVFAGTPARNGTKARSIQVSFTSDGLVHAPTFDASNGRIHLFYPDRDHPEVQGLLNSKRNRFCYFWRSANGGHTHAWLLSSQ